MKSKKIEVIILKPRNPYVVEVMRKSVKKHKNKKKNKKFRDAIKDYFKEITCQNF